LTVVDRVLTALVLVTVFTAGAVAVTPSTLLVSVLTALVNILVVPAVMAGVKFNPAEAIPFIVEVTVDPASVKVLVFIMATPAPATPLTVVDSVLTALVLETELIGDAVAITPFTWLVSTFPALVRVLVVDPRLVTNCDHTGAVGIPVFTIKAFRVVLKINKPVAGKMIAFC